MQHRCFGRIIDSNLDLRKMDLPVFGNKSATLIVGDCRIEKQLGVWTTLYHATNYVHAVMNSKLCKQSTTAPSGSQDL